MAQPIAPRPRIVNDKLKILRHPPLPPPETGPRSLILGSVEVPSAAMLESRTPPATTDLNGSPVDLGVLRAQTGGNANLEREILGLYLRHCPEDLAALKVADAPEARRQIAHRMVG